MPATLTSFVSNIQGTTDSQGESSRASDAENFKGPGHKIASLVPGAACWGERSLNPYQHHHSCSGGPTESYVSDRHLRLIATLSSYVTTASEIANWLASRFLNGPGPGMLHPLSSFQIARILSQPRFYQTLIALPDRIPPSLTLPSSPSFDTKCALRKCTWAAVLRDALAEDYPGASTINERFLETRLREAHNPSYPSPIMDHAGAARLLLALQYHERWFDWEAHYLGCLIHDARRWPRSWIDAFAFFWQYGCAPSVDWQTMSTEAGVDGRVLVAPPPDFADESWPLVIRPALQVLAPRGFVAGGDADSHVPGPFETTDKLYDDDDALMTHIACYTLPLNARAVRFLDGRKVPRKSAAKMALNPCANCSVFQRHHPDEERPAEDYCSRCLYFGDFFGQDRCEGSLERVLPMQHPLTMGQFIYQPEAYVPGGRWFRKGFLEFLTTKQGVLALSGGMRGVRQEGNWERSTSWERTASWLW